MKRLSWKYLAGLVDGEGCIDVQITKLSNAWYIRPRLRIGLCTSSAVVIEMLQNSYGGTISHRDPAGSHTGSYTWELAGYKANIVLRNIVNSLILKKEQARLCLWMETNVKGKQVGTEVRDVIRTELKLMKRDPHRLSEKTQDRVLAML